MTATESASLPVKLGSNSSGLLGTFIGTKSVGTFRGFALLGPDHTRTYLTSRRKLIRVRIHNTLFSS